MWFCENVLYFFLPFTYSLAQWGAKCEIFEVSIFGCIKLRSVRLAKLVLYVQKFLQRKPWSCSLLARAAISDFLKVWIICLCVSRDNLWYTIKQFETFCSNLTVIWLGRLWDELYIVVYRVVSRNVIVRRSFETCGKSVWQLYCGLPKMCWKSTLPIFLASSAITWRKMR